MSVADNQQRVLLRLLAALRPHWRRDPSLPARIQSLLARQRSFGSRDRRLYRELIYTTLRHLPWIEPLLSDNPAEAVRRVAWLAADIPATQAFREAAATGTAPVGDKADLLPPWFRAHCPALFAGPELDVQLRRAPLWLRLQTDEPGRVFDEFAARGWRWRRAPALEGAIQVFDDVDVTRTGSWRDGRFEVQDLGSQMILASVGIEPGTRWLDACAGAGGKALQLARLLGPEGHVTAHDVRPAALEELRRRALRAGVPCRASTAAARYATPGASGQSGGAGFAPIATTVAPPEGEFDGVLVDAPCSGSGTWRRAPHLKWITSESSVAGAVEIQGRLLARFAAHVRPGGLLVYATCSLSALENEGVVARFLERHADFQPRAPGRTFGATQHGPGFLILPALHDTDGFFVAPMRRADGGR